MNKYDAVIVGGGFAGIYMLYRAKKLGLKAKLLEAGDGAGGTWYWNRYPGARCDIESMQYSYQFDDALQQEWEWSEKYASQLEILKYVEHVIERYGLGCDMLFNTRLNPQSTTKALIDGLLIPIEKPMIVNSALWLQDVFPRQTCLTLKEKNFSKAPYTILENGQKMASTLMERKWV